MKLLNVLCCPFYGLTQLLNFLSHFANLGIRMYLFDIFFSEAVHRAMHWEETIRFFTKDYMIPAFMTPETTAYFYTGIGMLFGTLLLLGALGRLPAIFLLAITLCSITNIPYLQTQVGMVDYHKHILWAVLLAIPLFYGHGKIALDYAFCKSKKCCRPWCCCSDKQSEQ